MADADAGVHHNPRNLEAKLKATALTQPISSRVCPQSVAEQLPGTSGNPAKLCCDRLDLGSDNDLEQTSPLGIGFENAATIATSNIIPTDNLHAFYIDTESENSQSLEC